MTRENTNPQIATTYTREACLLSFNIYHAKLLDALMLCIMIQMYFTQGNRLSYFSDLKCRLCFGRDKQTRISNFFKVNSSGYMTENLLKSYPILN